MNAAREIVALFDDANEVRDLEEVIRTLDHSAYRYEVRGCNETWFARVKRPGGDTTDADANNIVDALRGALVKMAALEGELSIAEGV